jgi:large subunit ribosomal protein L21
MFEICARSPLIFYAVIQTGGKQYRVEPGQTLAVEKLPYEVGERVEFDDVLLVSDDDNVSVGRPTVDGAKVVAEVTAQTKDKKIIVFKYKSKTRYRRKNGHRQPVTELAIRQILTA